MSSKSLARDAIRHPVKSVQQLTQNWPLLVELAQTRDYSEAYRRFQNRRMVEDPKASVGGWGDGIGQLQHEFLVERGLGVDDTLLDIGCGTLRAGRYFIDYLDGGYTGMDISETAIEEGERLLPDDVRESEYRLLSNHDLRCREFRSGEFDYALAQSVLTHIPEGDAEELLTHLPDVMVPGGEFYATVNQPVDGSDYRVAGVRTYRYSLDKLRDLGGENWEVEAVPHEAYPHPGGQEMVALTLRGEGDD